MTRFARRYSIPRTAQIARRAVVISEDEAFSRTIAAIKTLKAMPDHERRFLMAGTKSGWVQTLVEWSDLVAQAEQTKDDYDPLERYRPKRAEISDALIAGEWFAKLAILPWNIDEFGRCLARYRAGLARTPQVEDQKFITLYAFGFSLKIIGERIGLNEQQAERRLLEIRDALSAIANGRARFADIDTIERQGKHYTARYASRRTAR